LKASRIPHVASPVDRSIAVQQFAVVAFARHADSIVVAGNRGEVTQAQYLIILVLGFSEEGDHGMGCIAKVDPLETGPVVIEFVQRRLFAVEPVQVSYEPLEPHVWLEIAEMPFQAGVVVPLTPLPELSAHEQHFLAGMPIHETIEGTEVGQALPRVAGHLVEQRPLSVHHFIVGEHQDEVFIEGIEEPKRNLILVKEAVDGLVAEVFQHVVHPAHVPLECEAQSSGIGGT